MKKSMIIFVSTAGVIKAPGRFATDTVDERYSSGVYFIIYIE